MTDVIVAGGVKSGYRPSNVVGKMLLILIYFSTVVTFLDGHGHCPPTHIDRRRSFHLCKIVSGLSLAHNLRITFSMCMYCVCEHADTNFGVDGRIISGCDCDVGLVDSPSPTDIRRCSWDAKF